MKKRFNAVFMFLFFLFNVVYSQNVEKIIRFSENETIEYVFPSDNYFGVISGPQNVAILYYKNGEKKYEKQIPNRSAYLAQPIEKLGIFVVFYSGGDRYDEKENLYFLPQLLVAYDLGTGQEVWRNTLLAELISVSPGEDYVIPMTPPEEYPPGEKVKECLEVIKLVDGSKVEIPYKSDRWATWLDENRIVIGLMEDLGYEIIGDPENIQVYPKTRVRMINRELRDIERDFLRQEIDSTEYKKQKTELEAERDSLMKEMRSKHPRALSPEPWRKKIGTAKLLIYHIEKQVLEKEKVIYGKNGERVGISKIYVDNNKNIFLEFNRSSEPIGLFTSLIKLSNDFDLIWQVEGEELLNLTAYYIEDELVFRGYSPRESKYSIIDAEKGEIYTLDKYLNRRPDLSYIDFRDKIKYPNIIKVKKNIIVNFRNGIINIREDKQ